MNPSQLGCEPIVAPYLWVVNPFIVFFVFIFGLTTQNNYDILCSQEVIAISNINERFREVREMLNQSQEDFAQKASRTRSEIKNIEYGKTTPKPEVIQSICSAWGIDRIWLETGVGEPFRPMDRNEQIAAILGKAIAGNATARDRLIRAFAQLPDEMYDQAERILEEIVANLQTEKE